MEKPSDLPQVTGIGTQAAWIRPLCRTLSSIVFQETAAGVAIVTANTCRALAATFAQQPCELGAVVITLILQLG